MSSDVLEFLLKRRSAKPAALAEPGPDAVALERILTAASRVPDHKKVEPWRFIVFQGEARAQFGDVLARCLLAQEKEPPSDVRLATERGRFLRAPTVIAVVSNPRSSPPPEWEQILSAGAVCMNLCLAANALGFGTAWITEWYAFSPLVGEALGLSPTERVAGFIYIGTNTEPQADRERPDLKRIVSTWRQPS
jgi:nitroreductase